MRVRNAAWGLALAAGLLRLSVMQILPVEAQGSETLVMVVNKGNSSATGMNLGEARKLMLGETSAWRNGSKVLIILAPPGSSDRVTALKKTCGMSEAAYTRFQMQAAFTGQSAAVIREATSESAVKNAVRANPGAVGFLHKSQVDDTVQVALTLE